MICADCGLDWPEDRFRADNPHPDVCFKCRTQGISLTLQGGKQYWNEDTERRRADKAVAEARRAGFDPVPAETKGAWSGASASSITKIGEISKKNGAFGGKPAETTSKVAGNAAGKAS